MGEKAFFQADDEDDGEFQALGAVHGHQRDRSIRIVLISLGDERCSIHELAEAFPPLIGFSSRIEQLFQIQESALGVGVREGALAQRVKISRLEEGEAEDLGDGSLLCARGGAR